MWCDLCGQEVTKDEAEELCSYWDCPVDKINVVDTGDALHQVLGEALKAPSGVHCEGARHPRGKLCALLSRSAMAR